MPVKTAIGSFQSAEGNSHRGCNSNGGRAADDHATYRLRDLLIVTANPVDFLMRQQPLIEHQHPIVFPLDCFDSHFYRSGREPVRDAAVFASRRSLANLQSHFVFAGRPSILFGQIKRQGWRWIFITPSVTSPDFFLSRLVCSLPRWFAQRFWFISWTQSCASSSQATAGAAKSSGQSRV